MRHRGGTSSWTWEQTLWQCDIPDLFRHGLIAADKGQGNPLNLPNSYRRITVYSNLGQIIETLHLQLTKYNILSQQNPMQ